LSPGQRTTFARLARQLVAVRRRAVLVPTKRDRADRDGCTEALLFTNGFTAETRRPMQSGFAESGGEGEGARQRATRRAFCCRARTPSSSSASPLSQRPALRWFDRGRADAEMGECGVGEGEHAVSLARPRANSILSFEDGQ
jgi:hypothetical protein